MVGIENTVDADRIRKSPMKCAGQAHRIWISQCEAAQTIKTRFGLKAAFDYLVGEKLVNFVSAASGHPELARELPRFVSEVRRTFTPDEIGKLGAN